MTRIHANRYVHNTYNEHKR